MKHLSIKGSGFWKFWIECLLTPQEYNMKYKYNINFSPIVLPLHEFFNIKRDNYELWNDLKKYGVAFKGEEYFYFEMYTDEKN